jgi:hypothetical protein
MIATSIEANHRFGWRLIGRHTILHFGQLGQMAFEKARGLKGIQGGD